MARDHSGIAASKALVDAMDHFLVDSATPNRKSSRKTRQVRVRGRYLAKRVVSLLAQLNLLVPEPR